MNRAFGLIAAMAAALLSAPATAQPVGDPVVLTAEGPSADQYPEGRRFAPDARIVLRPGDIVTLVRGRFARTFRGPGSFVTGNFAAQHSTRPSRNTIGARPNDGPSPPPPTGSGAGVDSAGEDDGPLSRFIICPTDNRCPR